MPTLNSSGDIVLVEHLSVSTGRVQVGDVVIARSVQNPRHIVCKRILGLEGDDVDVKSPTRQGSSRKIKVWCDGVIFFLFPPFLLSYCSFI